MDTIETRQGRAGMNTHETIPNLSAEDLATFLATDIMYGDTKLTIGTMPVCAILYFAQYGANKSRQDSVAGWANAIAGKGENAWSTEDRAAYVKDNGLADDSAQTIMEHRMVSRLDAILSDSIGARGASGPRKVGRDKMLWIEAKAHLERRVNALNATRKGKIVLPTKADELKPYITKELEKFQTEIETAVDNMLTMAKTDDSAPIGDLLGLF